MQIHDARFIASARTIDALPPPLFFEVAFAGRSNVGKSSLINRLLNRRRLVRTSGTPGCTRGIDLYRVKVREATVDFVDLPGYGFAKISKVDRQRVRDLISHFFEQVSGIRLILILIDSRRGFMDADLEILSKIIDKNFKLLTVLTKSDKLKISILQNQISNLQQGFGLKAIPFSIKSNDDRLEILKYIKQSIKE